MRWPTGTEVTRLRSGERNFSSVYLGVQRGKERGDFVSGTLMVGQHYQITAVDGYVAAEHLFYLGNASLNGTDIRPNMTLLVGTHDDPSAYGSVRIRAIGLNAAPTADDGFYLEPNDLRTEGYLQPGNYIWVDGVYRLYRKLPYILNGVVYEDGNSDTALGAAGIPGYGIAYAANYLDRPIALMGSPRFAWTGESIDFYGWRSHGRSTHGIQNWTWDFDGGVCVGPGIGFPGSPGHPVHARWDSAGEYIVSLVVEDNSGKAGNDAYGMPFTRHRAVRPVLVYDRPGEGANTPYENFEVESLTGKYGSGWSAKIKVFGTADRTEFPDNALIIIFAEDWYGGDSGSIGGWYGQEGILFCGYIRAGSVVVDFEKSSVSFEAQTIEQWMKDIGVWPANFTSTAGSWHGFANMTIEDILWYLTEHRSNLKDVTDCFFASDVGALKQVDFLDLTEASLYDQMSEQIGSCFFGRVSASRHGSIHLSKHKNMLDLSERVWWGPPIYSFSKQDWTDELQIGEERQRDSVAQVDFIGFIYDTNGNPQEVYSLAPARQTNFGKIEKVTGILLTGQSIAAAQAENNTLSGLYRAWKNIRFPHIRVPTRTNNRVLEPALLDYFAIVLEADDTERGYVWDGKEFLCTGLSIKVDNENGIISTDVEGEASTWGPDGVAGPYPNTNPPSSDPSDENPPEYWGNWPDDDPPPWGPGDAEVSGEAYLALGNGHVIRVTGATSSDPLDTVYEDLGEVDSGGLYWIELDKFDPENTAMVSGPNGIWKTTNLSAAIPTWTQVVVLPANSFINMIVSSSIQQDLWMACGSEDPVWLRVKVWWTTRGGNSWGWTIAPCGVCGCLGAFPWPHIELSSHNPDKAWLTYYGSTPDCANVWQGNRTINMWMTSTCMSDPPAACHMQCTYADQPDSYAPPSHHRYTNNPSDLIGIWGGGDIGLGGADDMARIVYSANELVSHSYCSDLCVGEDIAAVRWVGCHRSSPDRWWAFAVCLTQYRFYVSDNGTTWTQQGAITHTLAPWAPGDFMRHCTDNRHDENFFYVTQDGDGSAANGPLWFSSNRGASFRRQRGNWADLCTSMGWTGASAPDVYCVAPMFSI